MNAKAPILAVAWSSLACGLAHAEPPLPPAPEPLPRFAQKTDVAPLPVAPKESIAPPSDDDFTQSLAALHKELEEVRTVRQRTATDSGANVEFEGALSAVRQRRQLLEMLQKLATSGPKRGEARQQQKSDKKTEMTDDMEAALQLDIGAQVNDPFGLGKALFKMGDYVRAEQAFTRWPSNGSNEWMKKYLIASCLRRQKKTAEAVAIYQDVILNSHDNVLEESARWQLSNMRWQQQMDQQLKRLRELQQKPDVDSIETTDAPAPSRPEGT